MNPPPGTYNPSDQQSRSGYGNYILSNFKTFGTTKIVPINGKGAHDGLFTRQSKDIFVLTLSNLQQHLDQVATLYPVSSDN